MPHMRFDRALPNAAQQREERGFTLPEMMVTLAIFSMVVLGVVSVNLFGMRMIELTEPKMLVDAEARRFLDEFVRDVREASNVTILNGTTPSSEGDLLQLEYWHEAGGGFSTNFTTYELDPAFEELIRYETDENNVSQPARLVASGIANTGVFRREVHAVRDHLGTNEIPLAELGQGRSVIALNLEFSRLHPTEYQVGPDQRFKSYTLRTKVAFRVR
jgi:prepilin-type N-terminal cleavage/methylation domain-containing protein